MSKLRLQEMGSRYLFIVLYVFLEHHLSRGDYRRPTGSGVAHHHWRAGSPSVQVRDRRHPRQDAEHEDAR